MTNCSVVQRSQLEGAHRLDAEYCQPEYLKMNEMLSEAPFLKDVSSKITDFGAYSQMNYVEYVERGIRFLRNQDIGEIFVNDSEPVYISKETYGRLSLKLDQYDIVTPRVGTLGSAAVIFDVQLPASANQNLAQIKADPSKIDPVYLATFLCSRFGKMQFERFATGNVQPWLNLAQIQAIKVFLPAKGIQLKIKKMVMESLIEIDRSCSLYHQAENLLLEELGLQGHQIKDEIASVVKLSEVKEAGRMDADYFQAKYEILIAKIKQFEHENLGRLVSRIKKTPIMLPDKTYRYIEISDIDVGSGEATYNEILGKELPVSAKISISGGELLVSKVRPTRGAVSIVPEIFNKDSVCSSAFSVFTVPDDLKEYLFVVLRSIVGKLQMEKPTTGTSYPTITDEDVESLVIPILSVRIQQKIAELVRRSHEARKKTKELLEEAKRKVEKMIEKGGEM